jgi:peptidyl-prolyl cis-trans isomerase A (cyclophilin A)
VVAVVLYSFSSGFSDTMVRFDTVMGNFHVQLFDSVTPLTVDNFLNYVNDGDYTDSFFHRLVDGFILQGGGFAYYGGPITDIPSDPPVQNEFNVSNTYGTIAMAKLGDDPNSATNQFFFNLGDNSANLDNQNEGFTVFGEVAGNGMDVVELLAAQQVWSASSLNPAFSDLPLINYQEEPEWEDNLEMVYTVTVVIQGDADGDGVVSAGDYAAVQANFGATGDVGILGDTNFDGVVDDEDYAVVNANFGNTNATPEPTLLPEPAMMTLMCIGAAALLKRKRK